MRSLYLSTLPLLQTTCAFSQSPRVICCRNKHFEAAVWIASVWESSMVATLVVFSWMTAIAWMLLSPGCVQTKAQGASGGKLHIGFSVLWCLIDSIFTDTLRRATSYIKAWTLSCLPRHCGSSMIFLSLPLSKETHKTEKARGYMGRPSDLDSEV